MEVHHHSHLPHQSKPWKQYLTEGLMIFVAVSLGYAAENIRHHYIEEKKAIVSLESRKLIKLLTNRGFVLKIWEKYGVIGLGLLGTMSVGAPISIGIGVGFNVPTNKMVFWCSLGVLLRCAIFTAIGYFSLQLI